MSAIADRAFFDPAPAEPGTLVPAAVVVGILIAGLLCLLSPSRKRREPDESPPNGAVSHAAVVKAAQRLNRASGVLALSVMADSGLEHWRGSFHNPIMYVPIVVSGVTIGVSLHGTADERPAAHAMRDGCYALAAVTALIGGGFHVYNVTKRPGGLCWQNLFYGAPIGAPWALLLAGVLGLYSERVREAAQGEAPQVLSLPAGRTLAAIVAGGLAGTIGEVWLLHFRGAFHNPAMFLPVTAPPLAAVLLANTAAGPKDRNRRFTRGWLRFTALLGFAGVAFHSLGVQRNMGGWRNWSQNILNGPPLPAPPSFTGLALAGLAALGLMDDQPDA